MPPLTSVLRLMFPLRLRRGPFLRIGFLALILFWMPASGLVQAHNLTFDKLTLEHGLSNLAVYCMIQDRSGFMWFGTQAGLNKYDGHRFTVYEHNPDDSTSLSENMILALAEDRTGHIWIGTRAGHIDRLNPQTGRFEHHLRHIIDIEQGDNIQILNLFADASDILWIGTTAGLFRYQWRTGQLDHWQQDTRRGLSGNRVKCIYQDRNGRLWLGTDGGVNEFLKQGGVIKHYGWQTTDPALFREAFVFSFCEDTRGRLWVSTSRGLWKYEPALDRFRPFFAVPDTAFVPANHFRAMSFDARGYLWIASYDKGIGKFDLSTERFIWEDNTLPKSDNALPRTISTTLVDRAGVLWVGYYTMGIQKFDPARNKFDHFNPTPENPLNFSVENIQDCPNGDLLLQSSGELFVFERKSRRLQPIQMPYSKRSPKDPGRVRGLFQDHAGNIWVGTLKRGLFQFDPRTKALQQMQAISRDGRKVSEFDIAHFYEDLHGIFWIGTGSGLLRYDRETATFRVFAHNPADPHSLSHNRINALAGDASPYLWIATQRGGLNRFDTRTEEFTRYRHDPDNPSSPAHETILTLLLDTSGVLWLGTFGAGLDRFDPATETFTHYRKAQGLPANTVVGILEDARGHLWLSTQNGLFQFDTKNQKFHRYDMYDGLQYDEFNARACHKNTSNGEMYFGGINGLNMFHPDSVRLSSYLPPIVITDLKVFNEAVPVGRYSNGQPSPLQRLMPYTDAITLNRDQSVFTLEFTSLDYSLPERQQFAYKMAGFEEKWNEVGNRRFATYTNLDPGEYVFYVKGTNSDGVWNEEGAALNITVLPPWWQTPWAYLVYFLSALGVLYGARRYELNRVRLKNQLKLEQVEGDKLRELDRLKSRFFANISHEFRTPLTLILGQIESMQSSRLQKQDQGKLQIAFRNARRLLRLINQLLDLSKLEAGSMELQAETNNLVSFLKSLVFSFESLARQKGLYLKFTCAHKSIPVCFEVEKMEKVFFNLLSNAFKFTPKGGEIVVTTKKREQTVRRDADTESLGKDSSLPNPGDFAASGDGSFVEIAVKDTGTGIPADKLPHIFDRFYRVNGPQAREHEGSGIGLALARELIELHGGKISVASEQGKGTEFVVYLPLSKAPPLSPPAKVEWSVLALEESGEIPKTTPGQPCTDESTTTILIVEDNDDVRGYLREQLQEKYSVIEASDGEQALALAQASIPDLIITDVMMPKMDGYQLSKRIRADEKTSHIPIVMLTARAALEDKIEGLETGADAYLVKPFSSRELTVRVANLILQRRELRRRFRQATAIKPSEVAATSVDQAFLENVIATIEAHFADDQFHVETLADRVHMSVSQLNRKLQALIDQPAGQLIRSMRLQRAADLLKQNAGTAAEICYQVGFGDQSNFTRAFKKQFGVAPSAFRRDG